MWLSDEEVEKEKTIKKPVAQSAAQKIIAKAKKTQKVATQKLPVALSPVVQLSPPMTSSTPKIGKVKQVRSPAKTDTKPDKLVFEKPVQEPKKETTKDEDDNLPGEIEKVRDIKFEKVFICVFRICAKSVKTCEKLQNCKKEFHRSDSSPPPSIRC